MKNKINKKSTLREVLQVVGTELLREGFNSNIHVAAAMGSIKDTDKVIITDMRFPNELKAVEDKGGITIRVNRETQADRFAKIDTDKFHEYPRQEHESETALDNAEFDYVIQNDGTLLELINKVREILTLINSTNETN